MILYNKSDLSHSEFASQGCRQMYVFPCAPLCCGSDRILLHFLFLKPGHTMYLLQSPEGTATRGRFWANQTFFTYSVHTPTLFSLHSISLHLKKLHYSTSPGPILLIYQGLCHPETAFLPPSTSTSTQAIDAWSYNQ